MYLIVSDIHGAEDGMRLVMKAAGKYKPDAIISAGDQCPDPFYSSFYSSLIAVRGNCDRYYEYMGVAFPPVSREMKIYGRRLVITHGDRMSLSDFELSPGDIFVSGHTHVPLLEEAGGIISCNPGSPSRPRSSEGPTAALLSEEGIALFSLLDFSILRAIAFSRS